MRRKIKFPKRLTSSQVEKIKEKLEKCLEFIDAHEIFLAETPAYQSRLESSLNARGYSLVKTTNLADCIKVSEFCENNGLELLSNV